MHHRGGFSVARRLAASALISRGTFMGSVCKRPGRAPAESCHFTAFDKRREGWAVRFGNNAFREEGAPSLCRKARGGASGRDGEEIVGRGAVGPGGLQMSRRDRDRYRCAPPGRMGQHA
jgi:hypothetical protein